MSDVANECECCGFKTTALTLTDCYARTPGHGPFTPDKDKIWAWMCQICRSTMAGNTYQYPRQYSTDAALSLQMQAFCTNTILAAIKGEPAEPPHPQPLMHVLRDEHVEVVSAPNTDLDTGIVSVLPDEG